MNEPNDGSWLHERLFERRIVLCRGTLDDRLAGRVAAELMTLDALGDGAVELRLDCEGVAGHTRSQAVAQAGEVDGRLTLYRTARRDGHALGILLHELVAVSKMRRIMVARHG